MKEGEVLGFLDEMEKISMGSSSIRPSPEQMATYLLKEASFMTNIGLPIVKKVHNHAEEVYRGAKALPKKALWGAVAAPAVIKEQIQNAPGNAQKLVRHVGSDVGGAIRDFANPVQNAKKGLGKNIQGFTQGTLLGSKLLNQAMIAHGIVSTGYQISQKNDPEGQGRSRIHRALEEGGATLGGLVGYRRGIAGGLLARHVGRTAGRALGKGIDAVRKYRPEHSPDELGYARPGY